MSESANLRTQCFAILHGISLHGIMGSGALHGIECEGGAPLALAAVSSICVQGRGVSQVSYQ